MKGKREFSKSEHDELQRLLRAKQNANKLTQKHIRKSMRRIGFYISDFSSIPGFGLDDFDRLVANGEIRIMTDSAIGQGLPKNKARRTKARNNSDEAYILDICDEILGERSERQKRFDFLRGDAGTKLPVDAFYPKRNLVVEYRERQHSEGVRIFDKPDQLTVSGVSWGEQRRLYDQRRRDLLPQNGITLVEFDYSEFPHHQNRQKRLLRDSKIDREVVRKKLADWI